MKINLVKNIIGLNCLTNLKLSLNKIQKKFLLKYKISLKSNIAWNFIRRIKIDINIMSYGQKSNRNLDNCVPKWYKIMNGKTILKVLNQSHSIL